MKKPYIVGIGGGTCSGKSTLTSRVEEMIGGSCKVAVLSMDKFYKWSAMRTIAPITRVEYPEHNHPDAVDLDGLQAAFTEAVVNEDNDVVLVEGVFALYFEAIREVLDLKVFVDLKSDERMYRRIKRMMNETTTMDDVASRYLDTVRYRHDEFVEPTRWYADLVINGVVDANLGMGIVAAYIEVQINRGKETEA